ncbi:hypothetical protein V8F33_002460 [Rhypophila sp. PSN 637]
MPSVKNPNTKSKLRQAASAGKKRKIQQQKSRAGQTKITKSEAARGARPGLLPNSGPGAALSSKKKRKMEKALAHALRRKIESGEVKVEDLEEVEMKDVAAEKTKTSKTDETPAQDDDMQIE